MYQAGYIATGIENVRINMGLIFFFERPNLFAICNNTFSKWWEG
jgi:hypothetical protein